MSRITVLDFGMGNLRSVAKALERAGAEVTVSGKIETSADGLVVPGQGAFGSCVVNLGARLEAVRDWIEAGRRYLGICLGLQILFESSDEEPGAKGASIFPGVVRRLPSTVKTPHIGWNEVRPVSPSTELLAGIDPATRFYFVHSYYPDPARDVAAATTDYGIEFCCAVEHDNVWATQFHPEKSSDPGLALLGNFVRACA